MSLPLSWSSIMVIRLSEYGLWTPLGVGASPEEIARLKEELGVELPAELVELWSESDGGELVLESPEEDTGLEPSVYSPCFVLQTVEGAIARWKRLTRPYLGEAVPFGSDAGSTLFVWGRGVASREGVYAVPRGDVGWESAAYCGGSLQETLEKWRATRHARRG